ncbi:MAG: hypothetical protein DRN05_02385 [Thermoplasmata archaeon]|nr:MAG: hypothetical protein DRN05_02385 [Thermoplasmata archaeon]
MGEQEKTLEEHELEKELTNIATKNILPQKIADKLKEKIKEKNVKISKKQLYTLVEKIKNTIPNYKTIETNTETNRKKTDETTTPAAMPEKYMDMKKLVETVEELKNRITTIEQNQIEWKKENTIKTVTTKDIKTLDETKTTLQEEIQPLTEIPNDPESIIVLMKWLQHLVDKVGKKHLPEILGYYVDIGWISDDVRLSLIEYSKGITEEKNNGPKKETPNLPTRDHIQSLLFIQKLKGKQLDERFMNKIDREMEKITKSLETYPFK